MQNTPISYRRLHALFIIVCGLLTSVSFAIATESLVFDGIEFVVLPGGEFMMGSPVTETDRDDYEELHRVSVRPFAIAKFEMSHQAFRRMLPDHVVSPYLNSAQQPAVGVTWVQAVAYADWLSRRVGRRFRLPTEAEWEYAARGGTGTSRHWGEQKEGHGLAVCDKCGSAWDVQQTAPVGSLPANPYGLHDMLGNVWEWTCSSFDAAYGGSEAVCSVDPAVRLRVRRGGGWADDTSRSRAAMRSKAPVDYQSLSVGFRLVLELH